MGNYDLPKEIEEYVHRMGRTGRLGNTGKATSFFDPSRAEDQGLAQFLTKILSDANQEVPDFLAGGGMSGGASFGGFGGKVFRKKRFNKGIHVMRSRVYFVNYLSSVNSV